MLPLLVSILEDDGVNNLTAKDASPAEKFFTVPVELFVIHHPTTFLTFHFRTLLFLKFIDFTAISVPRNEYSWNIYNLLNLKW